MAKPKLTQNAWVRFAARRVVALACVLTGLVVAVFLMLRLVPGDPAISLGGISATPEDRARIRHELGLDHSIPQQFVTYVGRLVRGDLGRSYFTSSSVSSLISERIGRSAQLAGLALVIVLLIAIPGGMFAGMFTRNGRHRGSELAFTGVTSVLGALPEFLMATFLTLVFAVWLRWLPVAGGSGLRSLALPVAAVCLRPIAVLLRIVRVETLNVLSMDFMRTARGKRLPPRLVYFRHALPHVVTAALTVGGLVFAGLIAGAVVVENVFARAGLGTALVTSVLAHDYPVVQGIALVLGIVVVLVTTIVDVLVAVIDPRAVTREV